MIYFTSDTHFDDWNVINFSRRPFDTVKVMNETLIENWNSKVKTHDVVYHLGDFSVEREIKPILERLNGYIYLIPGNHDHGIIKMVNREPTTFAKYYNFRILSALYEIDLKGVNISLCHYPLRVWNQQHKGAFHLHGHSHGTLNEWGRAMDVGVDANDYRPISIDEVFNKLSETEIHIEDYHETATSDTSQ